MPTRLHAVPSLTFTQLTLRIESLGNWNPSWLREFQHTTRGCHDAV
jgi:hypothetical protein